MEDEKNDEIKFVEFDGDIIEKLVQKEKGEQKIIRYQKGNCISKSKFSKCYKCLCLNTKEIFILKELNEKNKKLFYNERDIHQKLDHPNIVKLIDFFEYNDKFYLLTEFCEYRDLSYLLSKRKKMEEIEVKYYILNLINALKYLHGKGIVHRDIKPSNVYITKNLEVKLGDFNLSQSISLNGKNKDISGTFYYMAPEIFEKKEYPFEVDIWPIGIIIYQLILGKLPFKENTLNETEKKIREINYSFPENAIISNEAKDLIKQILIKNPKERLNLCQILKQEFFNFDNILTKIPIKQKDEENIIENNDNHILDIEIINSHLKKFVSIDSDIFEYSNIKQVQKNIYIKDCFIDFDKNNIFGLFYQLNNENVGIFFKDRTQIFYIHEKKIFCYINGKVKKIFNPYFDTFKFGADFEKKVKIIEYFYQNIFGKKQQLFQIKENLSEEEASSNTYFQNYTLNLQNSFDTNEKFEKTETINFQISSISKKTENVSISQNEDDNEYIELNIIYAKKYFLIDENAIIFILNNGLLQYFFFNGDILLLDHKRKQAEIIKKNLDILEKNTFSFHEINGLGNDQIKKYFIYAKSSFNKIKKNIGIYSNKYIAPNNEKSFFLSSSNISNWKYQILNDSSQTFYGLNSLKSISLISKISGDKSSQKSIKEIISKISIPITSK